jgi:4-diphosphocytidyl-2-C-methyl-D-erythritol kinase
MRARAFAKINLSLRVLGTRSDGYHELRTIFQSIALHDTLTIRSAAGPLRLTCDDPSLACDGTNLVWRAAERLWNAARRRGRPAGVAIHLQKRIPLQSGLGGGSSDAAAALRAIAKVWRVDPQCVREAAVALGADVPYFLEGGSVLGLERGDVLFPLIDRPRQWVVIVVPPFGVSTEEAYAWFDDDCRHQHSLLSRGAPPPRADALATFLDARGAPSPLASLARSRSLEPRALRSRVSRTERRSQQTTVGTRIRSVSDGSRAGVGPRAGLRNVDGDNDGCNDLEIVVAKRHPEIRRIVSLMRRAGATCAAMSGSGSAVFGLFDSKTAALDAASAGKRGNRCALVTRTITRAEYRRLAGK